jgi:ATP-grasp domain, R2K clade family 3
MVGRRRLPADHRTPDTPSDPPPGVDLSPFTALIGPLGMPLVTADIARRADGNWRLIELGDGWSKGFEPLTFCRPCTATSSEAVA